MFPDQILGRIVPEREGPLGKPVQGGTLAEQREAINKYEAPEGFAKSKNCTGLSKRQPNYFSVRKSKRLKGPTLLA